MISLLKCITLSVAFSCYSIAAASNDLINIEGSGLDSDVAGLVQAAAFKNPPNEYRITQYELTSNTLERYPQYGIGGTMAFFYSILYPECGKGSYKVGANRSAFVNRLIDAAKAIDYQVWLADDWGYPSGMAGGRVVSENPDYEVKGLTMLTVKGFGRERVLYTLPEDLHDIVCANLYPCKASKIDMSAGEAVKVSSRHINVVGLNGKWELKVFARYTRNKDVQAQSTMPQFGHTGRYPDLMNREAMQRFIANMHEPILELINDPAKKIEGFYSNEPNLMQTHWTQAYDAPYACVPWSDGLPALFLKMHGYQIDLKLPFLFEGISLEARRTRVHYRQAVAELLTDSYARQIRDWCNTQGILSSGHFLLNQYISMHVQGYGDLMKFVSEFDVPGIDIPIPNPDEFADFSYEQSRLFSSVASWKARDQTIMLLDPIIGGYGLTRLSPGLPLLLNSINMACFHGVNHFSAYLPFDAKRIKDDYGRDTISKGYSVNDYNFLNEYTGRMTQVLRGANRSAGIGLYYPIAMFQADLTASNKFWPSIVELHEERQRNWQKVERSLINKDLEYMIVHPEAIASSKISQGIMEIGRGAFHTLVIPHMDFIPLQVAQKLAAFRQQGGRIFWVDSIANYAEHARNDTAVSRLLKGARTTSISRLTSLLTGSNSQTFSLSFNHKSETLAVGRFVKAGQQFYLLVNRSQKKLSVRVHDLNSQASDRFKILDPTTGEIDELVLPCKLEFDPNRSLFLVCDH